jgi:hypothetical protein
MNTTRRPTRPRHPYYRFATLFPIAARPRVISLKNRYCRRVAFSASSLLGILFSLTIVVGLYFCTIEALNEIRPHSTPISFTSPVVSGSFAALFMLVLISAAISAVSCMYMGHDVELLLSSPLPPTKLLWGRTCEVGISAAWIATVFSAPLYLAFGNALNAHWAYFVMAPVLLALLLSLAVLVGIFLAILFLSFVPPWVVRVGVVVLFVGTVMLLGMSLEMIPEAHPLRELVSSRSNMELYAWLHQTYMPTYRMSHAVNALCRGEYGPACRVIAEASLCLILLWRAVAFTFRRLHQATYSALRTQTTPTHIFPQMRHSRGTVWCPERLRPTRALIMREFFSFTRDLTHTLQLTLLLTISLLYLYNLKGVESPIHVDSTVLRLWDICMIFASVILSSIILLSICARFVFPSISLEGQAVWLLQAAPISAREILRAKYLGWFIPMIITSSIIFGAGGLSLGLEPLLVLSLITIGAILSHGLVALGIGLGSHFARFEWEHPSEISTSWGGLLYTIVALTLLAVSMIPISLSIGLYLLFPDAFQHGNNLTLLLTLGGGSLLLLHFVTGRIGLRIGIRALERLQH